MTPDWEAWCDRILKLLRARFERRHRDATSAARKSRELGAEYDGRVSELNQVISAIETLLHHEDV